MYGQIATVAFVGIEAKPVEVQVRISSGGHVFAATYEEHLRNVARWREIERKKAANG